MSGSTFRVRHFVCALILGGLLNASLSSDAAAGGLFHRRNRTVVATTVVVPAPAPVPVAMPVRSSAPLGSFYATPYVNVRGNFPAGSGYSPLGQYGDTTMALYGPMSALREIAAPVPVYSRGYDGRVYVSEATGFSTPNAPELSPIVYPTQGTYYYGFRRPASAPWRQSGANWVDLD
jgi:hypothetical protein